MATAQGYRAAVGSTCNYAAPIYDRVRAAMTAGDFEEARLWQGRALAIPYRVTGEAGYAKWHRMIHEYAHRNFEGNEIVGRNFRMTDDRAGWLVKETR